MIGQTISHYKILEKLGEGGMGVVYKAHDTTLDRTVALKFLPHYLSSDAAEKERFYHEARAAASLTHAHVAVIHEIGETADGQLFIAMEYVGGKTLKELVASEPPSVKRVLDIAIQACEGLGAAHEKGVVHRDIKSDNIILTPKGQVKITDFGLAKLKGATKLTKAGSTLGTAAYMSPEQAQGEEVDQRSDIFSFGVVLYELLTTKLPFHGEHQAAMLYSLVNEDPAPLPRFNEKVTPGLERIVAKALAKEKDERYQHADDMLADLRSERKNFEYARAGYVRGSSIPGSAIAGPAPSLRQQQQRQTADQNRDLASRASGGGPASRLPKPGKNFRTYSVSAAVFAALLILLVVLNPFNFEISQKRAVASGQKSVAVLPFTNMSGDKEDEFFSDGITEDIITQLSTINDLKVISRTSVMHYKNSDKNIRDIGRELNVATILEGSVRRAGNEVRIVAQLIDASNDEHLWAQTYDKEMTQIFAIQSDVAQQIAGALKAKLSPREKERIEKKPTEDLDAYAFYLKGREYYARYDKADNENAIVLFKKALDLDRNYALAYAGLGDAYGQRVSKFGFQGAWVDSAIAMSNKALSVDPNLAEGYKALGLAFLDKGWYRKALETNLKAVELNSNYVPAVGNVGFLYMFQGRFDEAAKWLRRTVALNPTFGISYVGLGTLYLFLCDDARAEASFNKALAVQPDLIPARQGLMEMHLKQGKLQECLEQARRVLSTDTAVIGALNAAGDASYLSGNLGQAEEYYRKAAALDTSRAVLLSGSLTNLGYLYWKTGRKDLARTLFRKCIERDMKELAQGDEAFGIPSNLATIYAIEGNKEESYKWLRRAIDAGWRDYRWALKSPRSEELLKDERFRKMMAEVRADVDEMRTRVQELEKAEGR